MACGPNLPCQTVSLTVKLLHTTNPLLLASPPQINSEGELVFDVGNGQKGQARLSVSIADDGSSVSLSEDASSAETQVTQVRQGAPYVAPPGPSEFLDMPLAREFTICVSQVNQPPSFSAFDVSAGSFEKATLQHIVFALNISAGATDTGQKLSWIYAHDNALIFADEPVLTVEDSWAVGPTRIMAGVMHVIINSNAQGYSDFTLTLADDGPCNAERGDSNTSASHTLRLTVVQPNNEPSFEFSNSTLYLVEDAGRQYVANAIRDARPGPPSEASQELAFVLKSITAVDSKWPPEGLFRFLSVCRTPSRHASGGGDMTLCHMTL